MNNELDQLKKLYKDINLDNEDLYILGRNDIKMDTPLPTYDNAIFPVPVEDKNLYELMKNDIYYWGKPGKKAQRLLNEYLSIHKDTVSKAYELNTEALRHRLRDYIKEKFSRITSYLNDKGEPVVIENGEEYLSTFSWDYGEWGYDKVDKLVNPGKYSIKIGNWESLGNNVKYRLMDISKIYNLYRKDDPDHPTQYIKLNKPVLDEFDKNMCSWFYHDLLCFSGISDKKVAEHLVDTLINDNIENTEGMEDFIKDRIIYCKNINIINDNIKRIILRSPFRNYLAQED